MMPLSRDEFDQSYPRAFGLIAGVFNQDWFYDHDGSLHAALDAYVSQFTAVELERTASEIDGFREAYDESDLAATLTNIGNNFLYDENGYTAQRWLAFLAQRLRSVH